MNTEGDPHERLSLSRMLVGAKKFDEAMIEIRLAMDGADAYNERAWARFSTVDKLYWRCSLYIAICRAAAFVAQWRPDAHREAEYRRLRDEWHIVEGDPESNLVREPSLVAETRAALR